MNKTILVPKDKIDKRHIAATALFAMTHVPHLNQETVERFLELINATGNYGSMSDKELLQKICVLVKHVPETCEDSLLVVAELLGIGLPVNKP